MNSFKQLDQDEIRKILDATDADGNKLHPDVLTPLVKNEEELFKNSPCPKCGAYAAAATLNTKRPFAPNSPLPNKILRCLSCATEFDPRTGLIHFATLIDGAS
jgi:hypothetical protein